MHERSFLERESICEILLREGADCLTDRLTIPNIRQTDGLSKEQILYILRFRY